MLLTISQLPQKLSGIFTDVCVQRRYDLQTAGLLKISENRLSSGKGQVIKTERGVTVTDLLSSEEEGGALVIIVEKERRTSPTGLTLHLPKINCTEMYPQEMKAIFIGMGN